MNPKHILLFLLAFILIVIPFSYAHGGDEESPLNSNSKSVDFTSPTTYIILTSLFVFLITSFIILIKPKGHKKLLFFLIAVPIVLSSLYLAGNTIYKNALSETGGPVHWHADYEVWACGEKLKLLDPEGIKNKVGSASFHEHNDDRIHFEGTPKKILDISLKNYFSIIGGDLEHGHLKYPTNQKIVEFQDGDSCPGEKPGKLKVYVNGKLEEHFEDYVIYPNSNVPPGDCIIVEFDDSDSETTDLLCASWEVSDFQYDNFKRRTITIGGHTWN